MLKMYQNPPLKPNLYNYSQRPLRIYHHLYKLFLSVHADLTYTSTHYTKHLDGLKALNIVEKSSITLIKVWDSFVGMLDHHHKNEWMDG